MGYYSDYYKRYRNSSFNGFQIPLIAFFKLFTIPGFKLSYDHKTGLISHRECSFKWLWLTMLWVFVQFVSFCYLTFQDTPISGDSYEIIRKLRSFAIFLIIGLSVLAGSSMYTAILKRKSFVELLNLFTNPDFILM